MSSAVCRSIIRGNVAYVSVHAKLSTLHNTSFFDASELLKLKTKRFYRTNKNIALRKEAGPPSVRL